MAGDRVEKKMVTLRLVPELKRQIQIAAVETGVPRGSMEAYIRLAIVEKLERDKRN